MLRIYCVQLRPFSLHCVSLTPFSTSDPKAATVPLSRTMTPRQPAPFLCAPNGPSRSHPALARGCSTRLFRLFLGPYKLRAVSVRANGIHSSTSRCDLSYRVDCASPVIRSIYAERTLVPYGYSGLKSCGSCTIVILDRLRVTRRRLCLFV